MTKIIRRWGYSKNDSKIFEIPEGEDLPEGYFDSPAKVKDEPAKKAKKTSKTETATEEGKDTGDAE